jgi:hypothetical protein
MGLTDLPLLVWRHSASEETVDNVANRHGGSKRPLVEPETIS